MHPLVARMVEGYVRRLGGVLGCVVVHGGGVEFFGGEEYGEMLERLAAMARDVFTFIDEAFRLSNKGGTRIVLAEGRGVSVVYGRISEDAFLVSFYRGVPAGTVMYETKRLLGSLRAVWDRLIKGGQT